MTRKNAKRNGLTDRQYLELRTTVLFGQDFCCSECFGEFEGYEDPTLHHKDNNPKNHTRSNLEVMCRLCHEKHHGRT